MGSILLVPQEVSLTPRPGIPQRANRLGNLFIEPAGTVQVCMASGFPGAWAAMGMGAINLSLSPLAISAPSLNMSADLAPVNIYSRAPPNLAVPNPTVSVTAGLAPVNIYSRAPPNLAVPNPTVSVTATSP